MIRLKSLPEPLEMMARSLSRFLPPSLRMGKTYWQWRRFLSESQNWSAEEIRRYQLLQLRKILKYAYENTLGYKNLFNSANLTNKKLSSLDDIKKFPFTTKEMFQENLEKFSVNMPRSYVTTAGSTGIPFGFYYDKKNLSIERAFVHHHRIWIGYQIHSKCFVLRGKVVESLKHWEYIPFPRQLVCSSYHLKSPWIEKFLKEAWKFRPDFIECYPSSGVIFARYLEETKQEFPSVKAILCSSENLYDWQKSFLTEVFNAPIYDLYGHCEHAVFAGFCEYENTYHVFPYYGYVELIDHKGKQITEPGQIGEIVATSFVMKATPFIRYRTKDFAKFKGYKCTACGRPYQIWEQIEGRAQDRLVTRTGRRIPIPSINMHGDTFDSLLQFQFYQDELGKVLFRFVPKKKIDRKDIEKIKNGLLLRIGEDMELVLKQLEYIPKGSRGKCNIIEQKLKFGSDQ